jgi:UDP-N-acetylmuramate dehydrogenase
VGGPADVFVRAEDEGDLQAVQAALAGRSVPVLVLGRGSNLLVADAGFAGLVVALGPGLGAVETPDPGSSAPVVRAGGAASLPVLARVTVEAGLTGLEWAVGVPGSVGGAVRMNAGGHGADTAASLVRYRWVDLAGGAGEAGPERLAFAYRRSSVTDHEVVVWVEFALAWGDPAVGRATLAEIVRWRRAHQPGGSNAGSVFTNPPGRSAGQLIDAAGLRGRRVGTAQVSEKHANFIQADEGGSADDVAALMDHVAAVVAHTFGVRLVPEVRRIGFEGPDRRHRPGAAP